MPPIDPRRIEFPFVLDALADVPLELRRFFGCTALYRGDEIVMIFRHRETSPEDNGVWLAIPREHQASMRAELPSLRFVGLIGGESSDWLHVPEDAPAFETETLQACELVRARDPRIGKVPKSRARAAAPKRAKTPAKQAKAGAKKPPKR